MRPAQSGKPTLRLHYFPRPYPDEVIGSVLIRACRHLGLSAKRFNREILGNQGNTFPLLMSPQLSLLAAMTGLEAEHLLDRHTVFPYVTAFLPVNQVKEYRQRLIVGLAEGLKPITALIQNAGSPRTVWRFCPACAKQEVHDLGESYWHRSHLLPGVLVCREHREGLRQISSFSRNSLDLPHDVQSQPSAPPMSYAKLQQVADASVAVMGLDHRRYGNYYAAYRKAADAAGYRTNRRELSGQQLGHDLASYYGTRFLEQAGCTFVGAPTTHWPGLMIRESATGPFAPIKHILMSAFLEQVSRAPKEIHRKQPGRRPRDYGVLDEQMSKSLRQAIGDLARRGQTMNAWDLMKKIGAWQTYRHNQRVMPKTKTAIELFRQSPLCAWQIRRPN